MKVHAVLVPPASVFLSTTLTGHLLVHLVDTSSGQTTPLFFFGPPCRTTRAAAEDKFGCTASSWEGGGGEHNGSTALAVQPKKSKAKKRKKNGDESGEATTAKRRKRCLFSAYSCTTNRPVNIHACNHNSSTSAAPRRCQGTGPADIVWRRSAHRNSAAYSTG